MLEHGWHPPLNFVVIGGGPTGVELAGAISDISQLYMRHDFRHIDPAKSPRAAARRRPARAGGLSARIFPPRPKPSSNASASKSTPSTHVTGVGPGWVEANGGNSASTPSSRSGPPACRPRRWASCSARPLDRRGCVIVDDQLNPPGLPDVFVLGDLAHFEQDGRQVPGVAQPAMQMGDHVGKMIAADLAGKPRPAFRYFDKGDMATIGRMAAVADVKWPFKAHMSGFPAWFTWLTVHIFFLIGFRNRLSVLDQLGWTYFNFTRGARLITGDQNLPGWKEQTTRPAPQTMPDVVIMLSWQKAVE